MCLVEGLNYGAFRRADFTTAGRLGVLPQPSPTRGRKEAECGARGGLESDRNVLVNKSRKGAVGATG
jgi:hypothetical protein